MTELLTNQASKIMNKVAEDASCSFCDSQLMTEIIDFGKMALAGSFLKEEQFGNEAFYPMRLYFCNDCYGVQIIDKVKEQVLFENYFYFSSSIQTLRNHFKKYAEEVICRFIDKPEESTVIEIGCNDGVLLSPLADQKIKTIIGVDPATNVVNTINDSRITIINDFFSEEVSNNIVSIYGKVEMVVANNVYAHIPNIQGITRAINNILDDDGVFVFEVHYLGKIINELQYDMIYHEHIYYYSLVSLQKHFARYDMMIFDVKPISIHAGSMRFYVCKKRGCHAEESQQVKNLVEEELSNGFHKVETFSRFAADIENQKKQLMEFLQSIKAKGQTIVGYGASGRANTMIQYCAINHDIMEYIIDDATAKHGYFTPGSHFLIQPYNYIEETLQPDYILIFAWSFITEISKKSSNYLKQGGKMIVPLPTLRVIENTFEL
jgi:methylation protein EvaC